MRLLLLCMIVTVSLFPAGVSTRAQTAKDLRSKYGPPSEVFQINSRLSLTAKYRDAGLAREVDIVQGDVVFGSALVSTNLLDQKTPRHDLGREVKRIVAELMPAANKPGRAISTGKGEIGNCYGSSEGTRVPVESRDIELMVYFTNPKLPEFANTCGAGEFVKRRVKPTKKVADVALRLLFAGPTVAEQAKGMESIGPLGEYYRGVSVKDGVAVVNFLTGAEKHLHVLGPACRQEQVLTPIVKTLKRFSTIKSVDFAINGKIIEEWDALRLREDELQIVAGKVSSY